MSNIRFRVRFANGAETVMGWSSYLALTADELSNTRVTMSLDREFSTVSEFGAGRYVH